MRTVACRLAGLFLIVVVAGPLAAQTPNLPENAIVNAASFAAGVPTAPGSIVSIFGTNFASQLQIASSVPLSTSLGGVSVTFNGSAAAPLFFVSSAQVNAQLPFGLTGSTATVVVRNTAGQSATRTIQIAPFSPAIFTTSGAGTGQGWVLFALEPTVVAGTAPPGSGLGSRAARAGDFLTIYCNGLGAVSPPVPDGQAAPLSEPFSRTTTTPVVTIGGVSATVLFSGPVPGLVGLFQINVQVLPGVPTGNAVPIRISMGGVTSTDQVTMGVQ